MKIIASKTKNLFLYKESGPALNFCIFNVVFLKILSKSLCSLFDSLMRLEHLKNAKRDMFQGILRKTPEEIPGVTADNIIHIQDLEKEIVARELISRIMCFIVKHPIASYLLTNIFLPLSIHWMRPQKDELQNVLFLIIFLYFSYLDVKDIFYLVSIYKRLQII